MRALVTGGAGFIGSHLVDALVERGDEVTVVDDLSTGKRKNVRSGVRLHAIDLSSVSLARVMDESRPEMVFHLAAQMNVRRSVADPGFDARVNILGGLNLYENCVRVGVRKVIFASSGGCVYGDQDIVPTPECEVSNPDSPYGISKLANEHYLRYYHEVHGLESVSLRYANIYGERQNPGGEAGVVAIFMSKLIRSEQPVINGAGTQTRDYTYVRDVVDANIAAMERDVHGPFNVGTGVETSVTELYDAIRDVLGIDIEARRGEAMPGEQMRSALELSRSREVLGWEPKWDLASGLRECAHWFRTEYGRPECV